MSRGLNRVDYQIIGRLIDEGSNILDLGCGNGELLKLLIEDKKVTGIGIEKNLKMVNHCLAKGLSIVNVNLDEGLTEYVDKSFDYVILSLTLQALKHPDQMIKEMLRIGKKAIVSFPNFGNWVIRSYLFFRGRMPKSKHLPYEWYDTPNIHFCTIKDFKDFCKQESININQKIYLKKVNKKWRGIWSNLFASIAIFVLE